VRLGRPAPPRSQRSSTELYQEGSHKVNEGNSVYIVVSGQLRLTTSGAA
jgi:hypothetical protein